MSKKKNSNKKKRGVQKSPLDRIKESWKNKSPALTLLLRYVGFIFIFYLFFTSDFFQENIFTPVNTLNAHLGSFLLNIFGQSTSTSGQSIVSSNFSVNIAVGCDGIEPIMMFIAAVLLTPVAWKSRFKGAGLGALFLLGVNLIRITTLYLTGVYFPAYFDVMHNEIWQVLFIMITVGTFLYWLSQVLQSSPKNQQHATS